MEGLPAGLGNFNTSANIVDKVHKRELQSNRVPTALEPVTVFVDIQQLRNPLHIFVLDQVEITPCA